jgi:structure-specific recognition protein 1
MTLPAADLAFLVQQRVAFEIPLSAVSNSNMAGKNEVALDFNPPPVLAPLAGVKPERPADELVEMRFYIPQRSTGKKSRTGSQAGGSEDEDDEDEVDPEDLAYDSDGNEISAAEIFHKTIMDQAELGEQAGDAIASFTDVSVVTPRSVHGGYSWDCWAQLMCCSWVVVACRGRYDIEMHEEHLRLHGKTYDYKVLYKHIHRQFLLPRADQMYQQLIVSRQLVDKGYQEIVG